MINVLLAGILICFLVFLAFLLYISLQFRKKYRDITAFLTPIADNQASPLAKTFEAISEMIGRAIVASLRGFLLGQKSIETRQASATAGEEMSASPLGGLVNMLPISLKKSLIKNPQLLDLAMGYMSKDNHRSSGSGGGSGTSAPAKFKL